MKLNGLERIEDAYCDSCKLHGDISPDCMTTCPHSEDVMIDDMACEHYQAKERFEDI